MTSSAQKREPSQPSQRSFLHILVSVHVPISRLRVVRMLKFPPLPARAAYLHIDNVKRRNALSLNVLRSLRDQLHRFNTGPDGQFRILPPFKPRILDDIEKAVDSDAPHEMKWLVNSEAWQSARAGLPKVIVLRTDGPVFCSGHDLGEVASLSRDEIKETFSLCAEVMTLIRRSPSPVLGVVQGMATAAGAQLAFTTDLPIATPSTRFQLPGAKLGLPCTSPSTAVSRRLGNTLTYKMLALAEPIEAKDLPPGTVDLVPADQIEDSVAKMIQKLAVDPGQPQAFGKWAYWTQAGLNGSSDDHDGWEEAFSWTGRVMALHARTSDAREGIKSFLQKRQPDWVT